MAHHEKRFATKAAERFLYPDYNMEDERFKSGWDSILA